MLQFVIVYITVVKPVMIVQLASAGANEMHHWEFSDSQLNAPRMNREAWRIITLG
jgi:hypothetical protein